MQPRFVNPRDIEQMWLDRFAWVHRELDGDRHVPGVVGDHPGDAGDVEHRIDGARRPAQPAAVPAPAIPIVPAVSSTASQGPQVGGRSADVGIPQC